MALEVLIEHEVGITPILEHRHDTVVQVAAVLVLILLLRAKEHVSHRVIDIVLPQVLYLEQHRNDLLLFELVVDLFLLRLGGARDLLLVCALFAA